MASLRIVSQTTVTNGKSTKKYDVARLTMPSWLSKHLKGNQLTRYTVEPHSSTSVLIRFYKGGSA